MRAIRLAVFGGVTRDSGSGPSGYYLLLESLLRRGHAHLTHVAHSGLSHRHVARQNLLHFPIELSWIDVAGDDVLHAARTQDGDASEPHAAAADDRHTVVR